MEALKLFVKTGFTALSDENLEKAGIKRWKALKDNVNYPDCDPPYTGIKLATEEFHDARNASPYNATVKEEKRDALIEVLNKEALYIQKVHGNVLSVLLSSGYDEKDTTGTAVGDLAKVENVNLKSGVDHGSVLVTWSPVEHAVQYIVKYFQDDYVPPSGSKNNPPAMPPMHGSTITFEPKTTSEAKIILTDLVVTKNLTVIIAAIGTSKNLHFSDPKSLVVQ